MEGVFDGLPEWILNNVYWIIGVVSIIFYLVFDRYVVVMRVFLDRNLGKIIR